MNVPMHHLLSVMVLSSSPAGLTALEKVLKYEDFASAHSTFRIANADLTPLCNFTRELDDYRRKRIVQPFLKICKYPDSKVVCEGLAVLSKMGKDIPPPLAEQIEKLRSNGSTEVRNNADKMLSRLPATHQRYPLCSLC